MCHGDKYGSGKTVRYKVENGKHKDAKPYVRSKAKKNFRDYEE